MRPLTATIVAVVVAGMALPFTRLGRDLGFVPMPLAFFAFLLGAIATYLALVER